MIIERKTDERGITEIYINGFLVSEGSGNGLVESLFPNVEKICHYSFFSHSFTLRIGSYEKWLNFSRKIDLFNDPLEKIFKGVKERVCRISKILQNLPRIEKFEGEI